MVTPSNPLGAFVWGAGGSRMTPQEIARQREIAAALGAVDTSPVGHWLEGAARMANALTGRIKEGRANRAEGRNSSMNSDLVSRLFSGGTSSDTSMAMVPRDTPEQAYSGSNYRDAIASIESAGSGGYSAIGPTDDTLGRALGRYQIMEANIAPWSKAALGREVSADEFLASPELQDRIFDNQFGQYVEQFGPEGAAQAWFAGPGGVGELDREDVLGTDVGEYGNRFMAALGENQQDGASAAVNAMATGGDDGGAVVADPSELSEEDNLRLAAMRGPAPSTVPYTGPGAQVMAPYDGSGADAVGPLEPRSSQPSPSSEIPEQFQNSQQLMNADVAKGILPTLLAQGGQTQMQGGFPPAPGMVQGQMNAGAVNPAIIEALSSPYASEGTRRIAGLLLGQQMEQQAAANDPMRPMELERARLELEAMRNPQPEQTSAMQNYQFLVQQGIDPETAMERSFGSGGTTVNNIMGGNKFAQEFAKGDAQALAAVSEAGMSAQRNLARVDRLDDLLDQTPQGAVASWQQIAGEYGVDTEGLDNIQAAQALINSMVPEQRPPGSGPMSDADLALFKQSLPRIINQPGGNQFILNTMRAIAQYDAAGAAIVQKLRRGELDRASAFQALQTRTNPLAGLNDIAGDDAGPTVIDGYTIEQVD